MNSNNNRTIVKRLIALVIGMMLVFTGCAGGTTQDGSSSSAAETETTVAQSYDAAGKSEMFTDRDLSGSYDEAAALKIALNGNSASITSEGTETKSSRVSIDGSIITIKAEGTYIFSGTLDDGMIIVDADDSAKVQIVLNGAEITSKTSAAIYVKSADKVFVTTAQGTQNTLANGGTFTPIDDNNIDGAVFAKDDITFNGSGNLTVTSPAGHGIVGKDDVKIAGGTINVTAAKHGVQANDSVRITSCEAVINSGTDGIHVSDDSDDEKESCFYIADGKVTIEAGDDGIHATDTFTAEGGEITVANSNEGLEALNINICDGNIDVTAKDDGLNASGTNGSIVISGGDIRVKAGGDGFDSNGSIEISGGKTVVEGPSQGDTSVIDYNSTGVISGGIFIGTGGAGMAQNFSSSENQGLIAVSVGSQQAGSTVTLKDAGGNVIAEQTPDLDYAAVYISTPDMTTGSGYTLTAGSYSETIELTESIYSNLSGGFGGKGGLQEGSGGRMHGNKQGEPRGGMHGGSDAETGASQIPDNSDGSEQPSSGGAEV